MKGGWAGRSLRRSIATAVLVGTATVQVIFVGIAAVAPVGGPATAALMAAHVAVAALALGVQYGRAPAEVFLAVLFATIVAGLATTDSPESLHAFALIWMLNLAYAFPGFLAPDTTRAVVYSALTVAVVPAAIGVVAPSWRWTLVLSTMLTGSAIAAAAVVSLRRLNTFTEHVDAEVEASARQRQAAAAARAVAYEGAERARILHDTVVNTLGAVASGRGAIRHVDRVRERCRRDIPVVKALLAGNDLPRIIAPVEQLFAEQGITMNRTGLDDGEVERVVALIPDDVASALVLATREAVVNVGRHAQVTEAMLDIGADHDALVVSVVDEGVGFDGRAIPGRGLAESLLARCEQAGIDVDIHSAVGVGTRVTMRCPVRPVEPPTPVGVGSADLEEVVSGLQRRTALAWAVATVVVGIVIEWANRPEQPKATYAMLTVGAVCVVSSWIDLRDGVLSRFTAMLLLVGIPPAYLLAAIACDFGRADPTPWQAIGVTGPMVLLLLYRSRTPAFVGIVVLTVTAAVSALVLLGASRTAAGFAIAAALPAVWVAGALWVFWAAVERVGARAIAEQHASVLAQADSAAAEAAAVARERWRQAGLQGCLRLLEGLATGRADPASADVRTACAEEERYVRNLGLLNPALHQMGYWLARSLTAARSRGIRLVVRTGDLDVDAAAAESFGDLLLRCIEAVPVPSEVTVSLFATDGGTRLAVVGPGGRLASAASTWSSPEGWTSSTETHVGLDIVEVVEDRATLLVDR